MKAVAHARFIRQSPYKVRAVLDQVRGMSGDQGPGHVAFLGSAGRRPDLEMPELGTRQHEFKVRTEPGHCRIGR